MASQQSSLLLLPRELRDQIYRDYLLIDAEDGYVYDFSANKLRLANKQSIDLSLMYTCRLIAKEMSGLPLRLHIVTFSTVYSDDLCTRAYRWDWLLDDYQFGAPHWYFIAPVATASSDAMIEEIRRRFGHSHTYSILRIIREFPQEYGIGMPFTELGVPSECREAWTRIYELAITEPAVRSAIRNVCAQWRNRMLSDERPPDFLGYVRHNRWKIPTETEIDNTADEMGLRLELKHPIEDEKDEFSHFYTVRCWKQIFWAPPRTKHRFSAAAAAIHFLNSIPHLRRNLRKLVLCEDHLSVASPACHIRGLVPFCQENPSLRIERHANLWRAIFQMDGWYEELRDELRDDPQSVDFDQLPQGYRKDRLTTRLAEWMVEASLPIIPNAITLVLDGDPSAEEAARMFRDIIQRDAAWQRAIEQVFNGPSTPSWSIFERSDFPAVAACGIHDGNGYIRPGFPELLRNMSNDESFSRVRCNFDPGETWDEAEVSAIASSASQYDRPIPWVEKEWHRRNFHLGPEVFELNPPLPTAYQLWKESVFPSMDEAEPTNG